MSGLNCMKLRSTLSNICDTTQLDDATKYHYAFKNFRGEPSILHQTSSVLRRSPLELLQSHAKCCWNNLLNLQLTY